jgi:N-acetylglucosaminyldiphosphoundecaprenol N-acetyl-beta-D-mannosaminyltransferase
MIQKSLLSLPISLGKYTDFVTQAVELGKAQASAYICVANVHTCIEASQDESFARVVNGADIVTPDGMPLVKGLQLLYGIKQERVAGPDLMPSLLAKAEQQNLKAFFYGSTVAILDKLVRLCNDRYPQLHITGVYSPPFRSLTSVETEDVIRAINNSGAHIVFVSLGCPKQERWMASMKGQIKALMIGVGAAFPVMAGTQKRAPYWMQRYSLEWLYRFCQEPRRLFKRYFFTNTLFVFLLLREKMRISFLNKKSKPPTFPNTNSQPGIVG